MAYIYVDKIVYFINKSQINKFINQQDEIKITFEKNFDNLGCVEIYVNFMSSFDNFVEYIFRKLGKDIIACIGIKYDGFEELKKINVMIPEIHKKMWEEEDRRGRKGVLNYWTNMIYIINMDMIRIMKLIIYIKRVWKRKSMNIGK
jgi:hypothetical protein